MQTCRFSRRHIRTPILSVLFAVCATQIAFAAENIQDVPLLLDGFNLPTLRGSFDMPEPSDENSEDIHNAFAMEGDSGADGSGGSGLNALDTSRILLVLTPHCTEVERQRCPFFEIIDAENLQTSLLHIGDILDIDIVLTAPNPQAIHTVRGWLQYNPTILEARSVELSPVISQPIPGEQDYDATRGLVKIGGGVNGQLSANATAIARVTFRVVSVRENTEITFHNFLDENTGETAVLDHNQEPLLLIQPSTLRILLVPQDGSESLSGETNRPYTAPPASGITGSDTTGSQAGGSGAFGVLQVQNVRVTSQGNTLYVGWSPLSSPEVIGYNVYYGTVSGRYIQRRSLPSDTNSLSVRDLETGLTYYVAVRAFNANQQETAFSQEVSVVIGRPETSTSPLAQLDADTQPVNPVETYSGVQVAGETGIAETFVILLIIAAAFGTLLAWRRQLSLTSHTSDA